jgi:malate dehydrogenase (oxaloacetate-decarboxylating)
MKEMFSVVYTPTEGEAIQDFSRIFRRPEGCFLNIEDVERVEHDLSMWGKPEDIDYIVVTGEAVTRNHLKLVIWLTQAQMARRS